jgi:serine/threonine protein kinase
MPKKLRPGDCVKGYEIIELISQGAMAISYAAKSSAGEKVFFKQYKSPSVTVPWYRGYVDYQRELKRRIQSSSARRFTYRFIDFFEADWGPRTYFQVFEFVEEGHDLEKILEQISADPASVSWEQRLTFAKVSMAGVNALHEAGVVHCDLKPPNIQLFRDETIKAGYVLKLIDMDFSILADKLAPWDGHQGYVGSPGYYSPEHLAGTAPSTASDVFTCGLILHELLGGGHPYRFDDPEEYHKAVTSPSPPRLRLAGTMPPPANDADVIEAVDRCLSPDSSIRPSAKEVNLVLGGRMKLEPARPSVPPPPRPSRREPSAPAPTEAPPPLPIEPEPPSVPKLELVSESGVRKGFGVRTEVGKYLCRAFGEEAKFFDNVQFVLDRGPDGQWVVEPNQDAKNQTMLNGKAVVEPTPLGDGDVLAVGREAKGITKLPLTVRIS